MMDHSNQKIDRRILIVDDEEVITEIIVDLLRENGFEVISEHDGREALTIVDSFKPDVIVSDLHMPNIDGDEFYRKVIEKSPSYAHRFIFMTGSQLDAKLMKFLDNSGCAVLRKPFDVQELAVIISARIDKPGRANGARP